MRILARTLVTASLVSSAAFGQTAAVSTAREIAKQGLDAYDAGQYDEAAEKLTQAYAATSSWCALNDPTRASLSSPTITLEGETYPVIATWIRAGFLSVRC
jgi:hypothetical protein